MALTAINPAWILGRPLDQHFGSSVSLVVRLLRGKESALAMVDWCRTLREKYPERRMAKRVAPKFLVRMLALFDGEIRESLRYLGVHPRVSAAAARETLGVPPRPARDALLASADFLVSRGLV